MVFVVFFPALMFDNLYGADIKDAFDAKLVLFAVVYVFGLCLFSIPVVMKLEKRQASRGALIQAIYRSNFIIMGLPLAKNIYGPGDLATTAMLTAVIVPIYNVLAVVILEVFRGGKVHWTDVIRKIATNPIIIGAVLGILAVLLRIKLPSGLTGMITEMSNATTVMALLLLGASFDYRSVSGSKRNIFIGVFGRLVAAPAIGLSLAVLLGFRGIAFVSLLVMMASPAAVSSFTMAEEMDSDGPLAGSCVIFSTALSCFTLILWLFLFKSMGMF